MHLPLICQVHSWINIGAFSRDAYAGGTGGAAAPSALIHGGKGARVALLTEFLPSLLSSEGAFSGISDSLL